MIPILDSAAMREADRVTINELGLPGLVLMESAATAVTEVVTEGWGDAGRVVVEKSVKITAGAGAGDGFKKQLSPSEKRGVSHLG